MGISINELCQLQKRCGRIAFRRIDDSFQLPNSFQSSLIASNTRMNSMSYGQLNILNSNVQISYNPLTEVYTITNFYRDPKYLDYGSCRELRDSLFDFMVRINPSSFRGFKSIIRCIGQDGGRHNIRGFFCGEGSSHTFLLVSPQVIMERKYSSSVTDESTFLKCLRNAYILDPSFKRIVPYEESGYKIHQIFGEDYNLRPSTTLTLEKSFSVPLHITKSGCMWKLTNGGKENGLLLARSKGDIRNHHSDFFCLKDPLFSLRGWNKLSGDPEFAKLFELLHQKLTTSTMYT